MVAKIEVTCDCADKATELGTCGGELYRNAGAFATITRCARHVRIIQEHTRRGRMIRSAEQVELWYAALPTTEKARIDRLPINSLMWKKVG